MTFAEEAPETEFNGFLLAVLLFLACWEEEVVPLTVTSFFPPTEPSMESFKETASKKCMLWIHILIQVRS